MAAYFDAYKEWVRENGLQLRFVEQLLSGCFWLLPNRFSKSEAGVQACHSLLGLVRLWHDSLVREGDNGTCFTQSMALEAIGKVTPVLQCRPPQTYTWHLCPLGRGLVRNACELLGECGSL